MSVKPLPTFGRSDYGPIAPRAAGIKRKPTSQRGWGPGWSQGQSDVHEYNVNRVTFRVSARVAPLISYLVRASNALSYDLRRRADPDGGFGSYANRAIKNSRPKQGSVHSIAVAIDQNTKGNPRGTPSRPRPLKSVTPPEIVDLWESAGFYWGGRFPDAWSDGMHFEYVYPPAEVANDLANAEAAFARLGGTTLYPTLQLEATNAAMVRVLQLRLAEHGYLVTDDGEFETEMDGAVRLFQKDQGIVVDGIVGPITWGRLNAEPDEDEEEPDG